MNTAFYWQQRQNSTYPQFPQYYCRHHLINKQQQRRCTMRFSVNTRELNEAVSVVTKAMPSNAALPILEGLYMYASNDTLFMKCTDLSLQIETEIPAMIEEEGSAVLPGRLFSDLAKKFTGDSTDFESDGNTMNIRSRRVKSSMQIQNADEYPEMRRVDDEFSAEISQSKLKSMIKQVIFSVSRDETKPILNGICMEFDSDNSLVMVALDGFRIAMRKEKIKNCTGKKSVVIPTRAMQEIAAILSSDDSDIKLTFSSTHIKIDFGGIRFVSRLLDGEYVNYKGILPKNFATRVLINCAELKNSTDRALLMARESKSNRIKLKFANNMLTITANSEKGNIDDEIEVQLVGKDIEIAFNATYIQDVMKVLDDECVYLNMNNSVTPCVIVPVEGEAFYYMILPIRLFTGA